MVYKKSENQVRFMLADTILALCGSTIDYRSEVKVEGLLGVTIDDHEVFLVQINKSMRKGNPGTPKKITSITGRTRRNTPKTFTKLPGKKAKEKTDKSEKEDRSEETPEKSDKLETRQSKRKRKASWKVNLNLKDDHDYTASSDKGDGKKKKDLVPLDSSDSEEETTDGKSSNVLAEPEVVYIQDEGASTSKAGNADSGDSDDEVPTMPDIEPMDQSDDEAPQAGMVSAEVVRTRDGQMVVQLTSGGKPINSAFEEEEKLEKDLGQTSDHVMYRMVEGGTIRGQDMLTDSIGYSYVVRDRKYEYDTLPGSRQKDCKNRKRVTHWRCSVRGTIQAKEQGGMYCLASVIERNGEFTRGGTPHGHPPQEGLYQRLVMGKMLKDASQKLEFATVSAESVFEKLVRAALEQDPSLSYEGYMDMKDLYVRRFNRLRKEYLSKHSFPATLNLKKIVGRPTRVKVSKAQRGRNALFKPIVKSGGMTANLLKKVRPMTSQASTSHIPDISSIISSDVSMEEVSENVSAAVSSIFDDPQRIQVESVSPSAVAAAVSSIENIQEQRVIVTTADGSYTLPQHLNSQAQVRLTDGERHVIIIQRPQNDEEMDDAQLG